MFIDVLQIWTSSACRPVTKAIYRCTDKRFATRYSYRELHRPKLFSVVSSFYEISGSREKRIRLSTILKTLKTHAGKHSDPFDRRRFAKSMKLEENIEGVSIVELRGTMLGRNFNRELSLDVFSNSFSRILSARWSSRRGKRSNNSVYV